MIVNGGCRIVLKQYNNQIKTIRRKRRLYIFRTRFDGFGNFGEEVIPELTAEGAPSTEGFSTLYCYSIY